MTGVARAVLWQSLGAPDLQQSRLSQLDDGWRRDGTVVTVADGLIVRSGPGRDFDRVASLNQGDWVEVVCSVSGDVVAAPVGDTPTWYRLAVGGYASGAFLDVQASPATPPC